MLNLGTKLVSKYANEIEFEKIKDDLDIPALLDELGLETYEYRGELWCSCPLPMGNHKHGDQSASFSVNVTEGSSHYGYYNCFVCGGGNIIRLVHLLKGLDRLEEAADFVRRFTRGSAFATINEDEDKRSAFKEKIQRIRKRRQQPVLGDTMPYHDESAIHGFRYIHPWCIEQGMTEDAVRHFTIGYDIAKQGITFPHYWNGRLVGWQNRDLTGTRRAKYLNTDSFPKRNTLYHYDCECCNVTEIVVVESPKTAAVMWGRGITNIVATFGASLTDEQMQLLWSYDKVTLWFDNDAAGVKATRTAIKLLENQVRVWVAPVPDFEKADPADIPVGEEREYLSREIPAALWKARNK